eukprot:g3226.t1
MAAATVAQLAKRNRMSSEDKHVLCLGMLVMDYCVVVDEFPVQDTKQTASAQRVSGGGNAANTAVQLSKLGVKCSLISKVGQDSNGKMLIGELERELVSVEGVEIGVEGLRNTVTSFVLVAKDTRTIISMPYEQRVTDVSIQFLKTKMNLFDNISMLYLDGRHLAAAAAAVDFACEKKIDILVEAELRSKALMKIHGSGLRRLLNQATYIISNKSYAQELYGSIPSSDKYCNKELGLTQIEVSLLRMLDQYPKCKYLIATLGDNGSIAVSKVGSNKIADTASYKIYTVDAYSLDHKVDPIIDTTGAGDAFVGGFIEGILNGYSIPVTLQRASFVGAMNCLNGYGARYSMVNKAALNGALSKIHSIKWNEKLVSV